MIDDWHEFYKEYGRCCACGSKMEKSKHINNVCLNKYAAWDLPAWGNFLASDPDKKQVKRAIAIVCDKCIDSKGKPKYAIEFQGQNITKRIKYHIIASLKDSDPIVEGDLK